MAHQINLYDPALCQRREWLTATNLALVMVVVAVAVVAWGIFERSRLGAFEREANAIATESKGLQDEVAEVARRNAAAADPRADAELNANRIQLAERREVIEMLKRNIAPGAAGFAGGLRALARQTPSGLWLTGFSMNAGGDAIEIKGRMTDPALLPEFIRRLNAESAFAGRSFAALQVNAGKPSGGGSGGAGGTGGAAPSYHEFSLAPGGAKEKP